VTREKASKTMENLYGCNFSKTDEFKTKFKQTCKDRYGVEHYSTYNKTGFFKINNPMKKIEIVEKGLNTKKENGHIYKWSEEELKSIQSYRRAVCYYSEKEYEKYKDIINPNNKERGVFTNHLDHIYPVIEGWRNGIDPKDISNYKNLRLVESYENLAKGERTEMNVEDFYKIIKN
jgi:hypothetical protein